MPPSPTFMTPACGHDAGPFRASHREERGRRAGRVVARRSPRLLRRPLLGCLVTESLPAAFYAFLRAPDDPVEVIRVAIELARDADTVGSMAGTLVGAYHGRRGLPGTLVDSVPARVVRECEGLAAGLARLH
jgi:ADP-ribosylglycohydrolase